MPDGNTALIVAGCLGIFVSIAHGILTHKLMTRPLMDAAMETGKLRESSLRLVPLLMQFSTIVWFIGGIGLILTPSYLGEEARNLTAIFVGMMYSIGAIGNFWGTRGKHFGWIPLALAVACIAYALVRV